MEKTKHENENDAVSCVNCRFSDQALGPNKELIYLCRYNPAAGSAAIVGGQMGPQWVSVTVWPTVTKADWCGKFERQKH